MDRQGIETPAIIVVGKVCSLADKFAWYEKLPLAGWKVLVTRPRQHISKTADLLRQKGAEVLELPSICTVPVEDNGRLYEAFEKLDTYQWIIFTSPAGVEIFFDEMDRKEMDVRSLGQAKIAVIGENLNIRRFEKIEAEGCVVSYIHGGGRIGVLVEADTDVVNDEIKACLKNVAMQVAAMSPKYVSRDEVDQDFLEHEKEILLAQAKKENPNKPDNIIEKMIIGRLNKEMKEICLLDQTYVQDSDLTVAKYVEKVAKENGANVTVKKFVRFETGEGLEKKNEDFAAEVAAQMGN